MEKIDILFIAFVIFVIITSCYICYLKAGINFLLEKVAEHHHVIEVFIDAQHKINDAQHKINDAQIKINTNIKELAEKLCMKNSSTGGEKQSN